LVHNANTYIGNSGGPIFDSNGRLIAIHGLADASGLLSDSVSSTIQKTGFNAAIPINTFLSLQLGANAEPLICILKPHINQLYEQSQLQTLANQITVKVIGNQNIGSGTIIGRNQDRYIVLTNSHVLSGVDTRNLKIRTHDGIMHSAELVTISFKNLDNNLDLSVLEFTTGRPYCSPKRITRYNPLKGLAILASGYPTLENKVTFKTGEVQEIISEPGLKEGYEIGYTNDIEQGMSGGAILNYFGELVGINGKSSYPFTDWYVYTNGVRPTYREIEQFRRLSWGIPMKVFLSYVNSNVLIKYNLVSNMDQKSGKR
jgi:S1-C subfamily serine protease